MRNNGSVTGKEIPLSDDDVLVTSTNEKGVIQFSNDAFQRIAGFENHELIGQAHNIVRHPDVPAAIFKSMWDTLKSDKHWMGVVKNRSKNGDHYWVDAYVTPVHDNRKITGYESVRVKATPEQIKRAESVYKRVNAGLTPIPKSRATWLTYKFYVLLFIATFLLLNIGGILFTQSLLLQNAGISLILSGIFSIFLSIYKKRECKDTIASALEVIDDPVACYVYTGRTDDQGIVQLAHKALSARIRTALVRIKESSRTLVDKSSLVSDQAISSQRHMVNQQDKTRLVADEMETVAKAVLKVSDSASNTSNATTQVLEEASKNKVIIDDASDSIKALSQSVDNLGNVIGNLSEGSEKISQVVAVIREIAEQTNLLALNAAIEAARAGEQGRGFAVVADEVRSLAQRTQESTQDISNTIEALRSNIAQAIDNMRICRETADQSVSDVLNVHNALENMLSAVSHIDQMSQDIAQAAEHQSQAANNVNDNTQAISDIAMYTIADAKVTTKLSGELLDLVSEQFRLVERFKN